MEGKPSEASLERHAVPEWSRVVGRTPLVTSLSRSGSRGDSSDLSLESMVYVSWRNSMFERFGKCVIKLAMRGIYARPDFLLRNQNMKQAE